MAEHDEKIFEHEIAEKLKTLDEKISIPEIPDAQGIFELAEKETKVLPFTKYRKFAATAAAVVLIIASVPVFGGILSGKIGMDNAASESAQEPNFYYIADEPVEDQALELTSESKTADGSADEEPGDAVPEEASEATYNEALETFDSDLSRVLYGFFYGEEKKEREDYDYVAESCVSEFTAALNSKRSIDVAVKEDSVSVMLYDTSADGEILSAFWVEGTFQGSGPEGQKYYISLSRKITKEDFDSGNWIPMISDAEKGVYYIDESVICVPETIEYGIINIRVEIDIASGEYIITTEIV